VKKLGLSVVLRWRLILSQPEPDFLNEVPESAVWFSVGYEHVPCGDLHAVSWYMCSFAGGRVVSVPRQVPGAARNISKLPRVSHV
jgi:hypothetical protein